MSALSSGFAEYDRTSTGGLPTWTYTGGATAGPITSPTLDCSKYQCAEVCVQTNVRSVLIQVKSAPTAALLTFAAVTSVIFTAVTGAAVTVPVPISGQVCSLTATFIDGSNPDTPSITITLSNRSPSFGVGPLKTPQVLSPASIPAGNSVTATIDAQWLGAADHVISGGTQGVVYAVDVLRSSGNWAQIGTVTVAAGAYGTLQLTTGYEPQQLTLTNASATNACTGAYVHAAPRL